MNSELLDQIILYECGALPPMEIVPLFQKLIDTGLAWKVYGYGSQALNLIQQGYCKGRMQ